MCLILYTIHGGVIKELVYKHKDTLGLDIGTTSVKFVQLKNKGKLTKLVGYGKLEVPENIIVDGVVSEPEKLAEILKNTFKNPPWGEINAKRVVASLPESKVFTRTLELPVIAGKELDDAVNFEIEQSIPMPASDLYIDWQVIEEKEKQTTVFLAAAPRAIVDSYLQLFKLINLEPIAVEVSMAAIARAMISGKSQTEPIVIFDLGGQTTNMAVVDDNLRITESHPVGGRTIRDLVSSVANVPKAEAAVLVRQGMKSKTKSAEIVKNEVKNLINETEKIIDYYLEKNEGAKITKVLLCGGLGFLPGLPELFKEQLKLEAKIGNPWVNISIYPIKPVPKEEAPGYAAAIGLALRGLND